MKKVLFLVLAVAAIGATSCKKCKDCSVLGSPATELCGDELETAEDAGWDCE